MAAPAGSFAEMVDVAATKEGLNDYQLSAAIGLMPGNKVCSPKQAARIRRGEQVNYSRDLVERLIVVLDLDPEDAWEKAGMWPTGLTADQVRELRRGSARERRSDREITTDTAPTGAVVEAESGRNGDWPIPPEEAAA